MSEWLTVCAVEDIPIERGVCALVAGEQIALFRTPPGAIHAVGNRDPFSGAMVLSRGIVGSRGEAATVASPMYKQVFDLATGVCLDDTDRTIPTYAVRVRDGQVEVQMATAVRQLA